VSDSPEPNELTLREEELELSRSVGKGAVVRARKRLESGEVREVVPREVESAQIRREPAGDGDSGEIETLPDGSISIPLLEEELVLSKRVVVRERIVIHKETETELREVRAELRRERLDIETTDDTSTEHGGHK
jgi:uncharacterized protein (TIGR02271 family)